MRRAAADLGCAGRHLFFSEKDDGPPFGLAAGEDRNLFGAQFTRVADEPIARGESPALFAGSERWQEWRRT
jgi:hypothetical protein